MGVLLKYPLFNAKTDSCLNDDVNFLSAYMGKFSGKQPRWLLSHTLFTLDHSAPSTMYTLKCTIKVCESNDDSCDTDINTCHHCGHRSAQDGCADYSAVQNPVAC